MTCPICADHGYTTTQLPDGVLYATRCTCSPETPMSEETETTPSLTPAARLAIAAQAAETIETAIRGAAARVLGVDLATDRGSNTPGASDEVLDFITAETAEIVMLLRDNIGAYLPPPETAWDRLERRLLILMPLLMPLLTPLLEQAMRPPEAVEPPIDPRSTEWMYAPPPANPTDAASNYTMGYEAGYAAALKLVGVDVIGCPGCGIPRPDTNTPCVCGTPNAPEEL